MNTKTEQEAIEQRVTIRESLDLLHGYLNDALVLGVAIVGSGVDISDAEAAEESNLPLDVIESGVSQAINKMQMIIRQLGKIDKRL